MLIPIYSAGISHNIYQPITSWYGEVEYTRLQPETGGMPGHSAPVYEDSKEMFPLMSVFPSPEEATPNDGRVDTGVTYAQRTVYATPVDFYPGYTQWNLSMLLQVQIPLWEEHASYMRAFRLALEDRKIEDTWITNNACIVPSEYETEITTVSWTFDNVKVPSSGFYADIQTNFIGNINPTISSTPCLMAPTLKAKRAYYEVAEETSGVLAFYDEPAPDVEPVTWEVIPDSGLALGVDVGSWAKITVPPSEVRLVNGQNYWEIQPARFERARGAIYTFPLYTIGETLYTAVVPAVALDEELEPPMILIWEHSGGTYSPPGTEPGFEDTFQHATVSEGSATVPSVYTTDEFGVIGTAADGGRFSGLDIAVGMATLFSLVTRKQLVRSLIPGGGTVNFQSGPIVTAARPKPWNHEDAEFLGYVPYHEGLWLGQLNYVKAYAAAPDARFDGLYFEYKVNIANVTRAWQALVYNRLTAEDPEYFAHQTANLQHYNWYNTETGEYTNPGNACLGLVPVEFDNWLTPALAAGQDFDWENYVFPSTPITLPGGSFFLEDGSAAPIYPTIFGAYVYDLHLKKWGKFDGEYKRLLDYSAINTYLPAQQSFARFGIFGGILTADGKIRIFDENVEDSRITYGKIGFYRQGMTILEEVRIHHKNPTAGSLTVQASLEGKLISPALTTVDTFPISSLWRKNGGYAARWHNLTIAGKFDLTYLEFRGLISGRR